MYGIQFLSCGCLPSKGSGISILVYEYGERIRDLHPCLRVWRKGLGSPSSSTSMGRGSLSLSTSMENDLSYPSVIFLIEKIVPSESIVLTRSLDPLRRSSFTPCSPKKASYLGWHESYREIHRSRDDFRSVRACIDPSVEEIIDP